MAKAVSQITQTGTPHAELTTELAAQWKQFLAELPVGVHTYKKVATPTGAERVVYDGSNNSGETLTEPELGYRYQSANTFSTPGAQFEDFPTATRDSADKVVVTRPAFNPLTLMLCHESEAFRNVFLQAFQNPDTFNDERAAFAAAFNDTVDQYDADSPVIRVIDTQMRAKPEQINDAAQGQIGSPKRAFLGCLSTALRAERGQKTRAAEALFDAATNERVLKNTGFFAFIWKAVKALFGVRHVTKTFNCANVFAGQGLASQPAQGHTPTPQA